MSEYLISQFSTFETCPLQYRLINVDRLPRCAEGIEAFLGMKRIAYFGEFVYLRLTWLARFRGWAISMKPYRHEKKIFSTEEEGE